MKALIVEDDITCRMVLQRLLESFGTCDVAVDGQEGVTFFSMALESSSPYDLVCLDIMMPNMDGHGVLTQIRKMEEEAGIFGLEGVKVIMTTALSDAKTILKAFNEQCEAFIVKPIDKEKLHRQLRKMNLISLPTHLSPASAAETITTADKCPRK